MFKRMVKTITIMNDAYEMLKRSKGKDESFSEVIRKLSSKQHTDLTRFLGILKGGKKEAEEFKERVRKIREKTSKDIEERLKRIKW